MGPDDAGECVAVGAGERFDPQQRSVGEQFLARRRPPQERKVRRNLELDIAAVHPKIPCMNHLWDPVAASSPLPARKIQKRSPASSST